jgi:hypothetical protein
MIATGLRRPARRRGEDARVLATLECEPQTAFNANAVARKVDGRRVGYLSREIAKGLRPFIAA